VVPRTDKGSRLIAAPPDQVYAALVEPEALTVWLPPAGMTGQIERFDLRHGGSYRMVLTYANPPASGGKSTAVSDVVEARFMDIIPGRRVAYAVDFVSEDPAYAGTMLMTWELVPVEGGTRVDITADDVPDGVRPDDHASGMNSSLMNLAKYLEA
jgi:uncharacterized protein YndB with AHSA1/START domain